MLQDLIGQAERHFSDGFSNLRCKMVGWGFEFLIASIIYRAFYWIMKYTGIDSIYTM